MANNKLEKLQKRLADLKVEIRELTPKLANMRRVPRYDPGYSEARIHNLSRDLEKLQEQESKAYEEYNAFIDSPEYRKATGELVQRLSVMINDLNADAQQAKTRLFELRNSAPAKILAGDDPLVMAGEILAIREQLEATGEALSLVKMAMTLIKKPPQVDKLRELSKGELSRWKDYMPEQF
jgi:hypothetical protein